MTKTLFALTAAALAGLLVTLPASAGNCRVINQTYRPTYVQPYSAPYVAPTYNQHKEVVTVKEVIIPVLQPLPYFVDPRLSYHYSGGTSIQLPQPPAQQQAKGDLDIDKLIDLIEKRVKERSGVGAGQEDGPPPVPGRQVRTGLAVKRNRCAECHTGEKSKGQFKMFEADGSPAAFDTEAAYNAVKENRMPPENRPKLSPADKRLLETELHK